MQTKKHGFNHLSRNDLQYIRGELYLRCKKSADTIEYPILIIHVDKIPSKEPIFF